MKKVSITILKTAAFFLGWAVLSGVIDIPSGDPAIWRFFAELLPLALMVVFTAVFLRIEKGTVKIPIFENGLRGTAVGIAAGLAWIGISAGILLGTRQLIITGQNRVPALWLWIVSAFLNVIMQELLVRGYIYQFLKEKYGMPVAVTATTALFTLMHGGAFEAGVIAVGNVVTMCLFTTALYEAEKTLLAPIMAHAVWNIIGSIFLGGVRLADDYPNLYALTPSKNTLFSGGEYMIEASIVVLILHIVLIFIFCAVYGKNRSKV